MKRIFSVILILVLTCILSATMAYAKEFPDVDASHWAYEYINALSDNNVINGYNDGTYRPQGTVKCSEYIKLVMAAVWPSYIEVEEVPNSINHWVGPYVYMAEMDGVVSNGEYSASNVENPITRIEMARIIAKADMMEKGAEPEFGKILPFIDITGISSMDRSLLAHAYSRGLIKGYDDGTFKPDKTMTRAEAATMIYRFTVKEDQ